MTSIVEMSEIGQSESERVVGIRGSLCHRAVMESLLVTTVSSKNKPARVANSSSYRGSISSKYIREGLCRLPGRKGPCTRV